MAVVTVTSLFEGWTGTIDKRLPTGNKYTAVYRVETDNPNDGPRIVAEAAGIPVIGQSYQQGNDVDGRSFLKTKTPKLIDAKSRIHWVVACEYGPADDQNENNQQEENPLDQRPEYDVSQIAEEEEVTKATYEGGFIGRAAQLIQPGYEGLPFNSAFCHLQPLLTRRKSNLLFRKRQNLDSFPESDADLQDRINDAPWTIDIPGLSYTAEKWQALVDRVEGRLRYHDDAPYWEVTWEILVSRRENGWVEEVEDRGLHVRQMVDDPLYPIEDNNLVPHLITPAMNIIPPLARIVDDNHNPISEPYPLDGDGFVSPQPSQIAARVFLKWRTLEEADLSNLRF